MRRDLSLLRRQRRGEHVGGEEIDGPIAIGVAEIDRHAGVARRREGRTRGESEVPSAIVQPELIGILEVIADVEVCGAITVHVVEASGEGEEVGLLCEGAPRLIAKSCPLDRRAREAPCPIVQKEEIGVGALRADDPTEVGAVLDPIVRGPLRLHRVAPIGALRHHLVEGACLWGMDVERVARLVRRHIEIEIAIAIHIGQGEGRRTIAAAESTGRGRIREAARAVVLPEQDGTATRADHQIEIGIAIHIGEGRPDAQ